MESEFHEWVTPSKFTLSFIYLCSIENSQYCVQSIKNGHLTATLQKDNQVYISFSCLLLQNTPTQYFVAKNNNDFLFLTILWAASVILWYSSELTYVAPPRCLWPGWSRQPHSCVWLGIGTGCWLGHLGLP